MKSILTTLLSVFIKPFFRENAGAFIFFYTVMILAVGHLDGEGVINYHYMLIMGMLQDWDTFLLVCLGWLLYQGKCLAFIVRTVEKRNYQFLYIVNSLSPPIRFIIMFIIMLTLFVPIGWYGLLITGIAFYYHYYYSAALLLLYLILLCALPALYAVYKMKYPGWIKYEAAASPGLFASYVRILIMFVLKEQKALWITIKLFSCALLYGFARANNSPDYDSRFPFLFFSLGILSNGLIIHRIRTFEESCMLCYRGAAVSRLRRWLDYLVVYALLFIPECITIIQLTPDHLHVADAINYAFTGFALVLLLNSISFLQDFTMVEYLKAILVVMCIQYFFVLADTLPWICVSYFVLAWAIFYASYYSFEKRPKSGND